MFTEYNWWTSYLFLSLRHKTTNIVNMKKIILLFTMMVGVLTVQADNYTYLTFETTDGTKASASVASDITLSINGA